MRSQLELCEIIPHARCECTVYEGALDFIRSLAMCVTRTYTYDPRCKKFDKKIATEKVHNAVLIAEYFCSGMDSRAYI